MDRNRSAAWYLAFFPNGMAMGILTTLIPLYLVDELKGSLIDLGMMMFAATASVIPASIYLGRLPDRYRMARPFILASLLGVSMVLFLMPVTTSVTIFQFLYVLMELFAYLKGPSRTILVAESFDRGRRGSVLAKQGFVEGMSGVAGLALCSLGINLLGYGTLLKLTGPLVLASFFLALLTIQDPPIYVERFLDRYDRVIEKIEKFSFYLTRKGSMAPLWREGLGLGREPNMALFALGRAFFSFAASNAFTSLPVYLLLNAGLSRPTVFACFLVRSVFGAFSFLASGRLVGEEGRGVVKIAVGIRMISIILLPVTVQFPWPFSAIAIAVVLSSMAFSWSFYSVGLEVLTVAYAAPGSLGVYDAITRLGGALGGFTGGLIPTLYGFEMLFMISSGFFALALLFFALGLK